MPTSPQTKKQLIKTSIIESYKLKKVIVNGKEADIIKYPKGNNRLLKFVLFSSKVALNSFAITGSKVTAIFILPALFVALKLKILRQKLVYNVLGFLCKILCT